MSRVYLDVDVKEKGEAKQDGARWDPAERQWYVDGDVEAVKRAQRWLPLPPREWPGPKVTVSLIGVIDRCWRCHNWTLAVAGVLHNGRFYFFEDIADDIATLPELERVRAEVPIGEVKRRWSKTLGRRYISNGCFHCDALMGNHPLRALVGEVMAAGVPWSSLTLATVSFPADQLRLHWYHHD